MNLRFLAHAGVALLALFCSLFAFSGAIPQGFAGDDFHYLEPAAAAPNPRAALHPPWVEPFARPLTQVLFHFELSLWGLQSSRYVLMQVLLHAANATILFALFRGPLGSPAAAGAAILFALGLGVYGEPVWRAAALGTLLATTFVLGTGIVALRAQLERTPHRRFVATLLTALLFVLALSCHESGVMALVMLGGLMWPHRRNLSSVVRKLTLLVLLAGAFMLLQLWRADAATEPLWRASWWLALPVRLLRLVSLMVLPLTTTAATPEAGSFLQRLLALVEQTRPFSGLALVAAAVVWFLQSGGALRWLLSSYVAFLLPAALRQPMQPRHDFVGTYLAAAFLSGIAAWGFYRLWHKSGVGRRLLLTGGLVLLLFVELAVVRGFAVQSLEAARSAESQERLQSLLETLAAPR